MKLRALEISDLPFLYQWENDAEMWVDSNTHNPLSQHLLREYVESSTGDIYRDGQLRLIIEEEERTMGCMDLFDFDARSRKAAIGMYIAPDARGKGVGKKAVELLEDYAFRFLGLHMLYAIISEENAPCLALYRKAGYDEVATLPDWLRIGSRFASAIVFRKLSPDTFEH